jgi:transcription elongation GreA/GreB family factor
MNHREVKTLVIKALIDKVEAKSVDASTQIASIEESKNSATKSSAGDKHETGRAMMERELAMAQSQLNKAQFQKNELESIAVDADCNVVSHGTLVESSSGVYFIGVALGKVEVGGESVMAISGASPIGMLLMGKSVGDEIEFRDRKIEVLSID